MNTGAAGLGTAGILVCSPDHKKHRSGAHPSGTPPPRSMQSDPEAVTGMKAARYVATPQTALAQVKLKLQQCTNNKLDHRPLRMELQMSHMPVTFVGILCHY